MNIFKKTMLSALAALMLPAGTGAETLYTCGDSTMADYATDGSTPTRGWGQYFGTFFKPGITVVNRGKGGMDVQNFYYSDGYWPAIKKLLKPGDYVLLQFAHNDEKNGGMDGRLLYKYYMDKGDTQAAAAVDQRGSIPHDTYAATLRTLVKEIRELGATPILASSICRMNFTADGDIRRAARHDLGDSFSIFTADGPVTGNSVPADDHSMDFRRQMEIVAEDLDVDFIDLTEATREMFTEYGQAKTAEVISDGQGGTHLSMAGAALIARRCAEMMAEQGILAGKIDVSEADLSVTPADGNLGEAYVGNILSKEFTVTGFGLSPESGNVTIATDEPFELSTDKSRWTQSVTMSYDGGVLIGSFYVRTTLSNPGDITGSVTVSAGSASASVDVRASALPIPGSGAMSVAWPLTSDESFELIGDAVPVAMSLHGLKADGYDGGIRLVPVAGSWPAGDIDESPDRYIEFGVTAPEGKTLSIDRMALSVGSPDLDIMRCHVSYSTEPGFANPRTFHSPASMAKGDMTDVSADVLVNLAGGETLLLRVYPWTHEQAATGHITVSDVRISGYSANASAPASLVWPLDKGKDNPASADTSSGAFAFTGHSVGNDLTIKGTNKPGGVTGTEYQPLTNNLSAYNDNASVTFTLRPKAGITFRPTKVSFYATRNGTNGGTIEASLEVDGTRTVLGTKLEPLRNNVAPGHKLFEFDVDGVVVYDNTLTLRLAIAALGNTKTLTIHSVTIEGEVSGTEIDVPKYSISATPSLPEAGSVTVTPNTALVDENTEVTVAATENFGYRFTGWTAGGRTVSTDNPYTFPATVDIDLVAEYEKLTVYPLAIAIDGGARDYMVSVSPEGHMIDGTRYYEAGTDVILKASSNRILTFTNWEDNTTAADREIRVDGPKDIKASYSADDFIVGWDFTIDEPATQRAADFRAQSDNAGLLSLHNDRGTVSSWLSRGSSRGDENGRYAARIWKVRADRLFYEISFSAKGYSNLRIASALSCTYNTYSRFFVQYSTDGSTYATLGEMAPGNRSWTDAEFDLPAAADNADRVYIRWYPDFDSPLIGNETDYDGLAITDIYVLADCLADDDDVPPVLTASIPADGATGASTTGSVVLTFDEKVVSGDGTATLGGTALTPVVSGKSVVFAYSGLDYNTQYTFSMPAGAVTDRNGNPAPAVELSFTTMERRQPEPRTYDAVVDIDGNGDYTSLQAAIDAAPAGRVKPWLIFVHNGRYKEHIDIPASKPFIHIIGQNRDKTVICDDRLCGGDNAVHVSVGATVVVNSNDCFFENITLENTYGHEQQNGPQALALNTIGDRTIFNNVAMLSYQDTWITPSKSAHRAYVRNSLIEGAVDFIYNSGDIYIENTTLLITRTSGGYIVAPSHAADVAWGYVFRDCTITAPGDPSKTTVWLGRPWHNFPKTVFLNTRAEVNIPPTGWYETMGGLPAIWADWNTTDADGNLLDLSQRRDTYYYTVKETGEKVYGTAKNHLTDEEAATYTLHNVLSGSDSWQPAIKTEACDAPVATLDGTSLSWQPVPYAICYVVTDGDEAIDITTDTKITVPATAENLAVQAVNEFGGLSAKGPVDGTQGIKNTFAVEYTLTGIYDIHGRALATPTRGINIMRYTTPDGGTRMEKVIIR